MNIGLLVLRLLIASILLPHALQKTLGWFQGPGIDKQAGLFESLGLRPGRPMVVLAAAAEVAAAVSLTLGLLTPLGALAAAGTMVVAGLTMTMRSGRLWNVAGGGEYAFFIGGAGIVLGFTGPGEHSVDAALASSVDAFGLAATPEAWVGVVVVVVALLAAVPFVAAIRRNTAAAGAQS